MHEIWLDGRLFSTPLRMHTFLAQALCFPACYGNNWDALYDMLTSLPSPTYIYFTDFGSIQQQWGRQASALYRVLRDAADADTLFQVHFFAIN